jgi:hypothetical protein
MLLDKAQLDRSCDPFEDLPEAKFVLVITPKQLKKSRRIALKGYYFWFQFPSIWHVFASLNRTLLSVVLDKYAAGPDDCQDLLEVGNAKGNAAQFKKAGRANRRFSAARMVLRHFVTKTNQTFEILIDFKSE